MVYPMNNSTTHHIELMSVIVNHGDGSKIIKMAKQLGLPGGTVLLARGTARNSIWDFLGLADIRKEVVLMVAEREMAYHALDEIALVMAFEKPNHGIAYSTTVCNIAGSKSCSFDHIANHRGEDTMNYQAITVIVDKGKAEEVVDAAVKAGSKGATIINARGSGIHETSRLFAMDIEPEKEIVLILSQNEKVEDIVESIRQEMQIDVPGNGIIYVQPVNRTYGLVK